METEVSEHGEISQNFQEKGLKIKIKIYMFFVSHHQV